MINQKSKVYFYLFVSALSKFCSHNLSECRLLPVCVCSAMLGSKISGAMQEPIMAVFNSRAVHHGVVAHHYLHALGFSYTLILLRRRRLELFLKPLLLILLRNLHIRSRVERIRTILDVFLKFDVEQIQNALEGDLIGAQSLLLTLLLALQAQPNFVLQAKLASGQHAFAAPEKHVVPLANARIAGTLVEVLVVFLAPLALEVLFVPYSVLLGIEKLELHLINVPRSRLVEPAVQAFFVLALLVDQLLLRGKLLCE